ncbi:hypothetical protein LJR267_010488 [Paraburkholderia hospita]|jgi:hypothetical protein|uniref:hypothetical protein n=1 Tax=Paraburkholderia hospita TaxID=169430 RepID=UPI003ECE6606
MSGKKILIISNYGGVGKSTLAGCLIHPRTGGEILSVESNNLDASAYGLPVHQYAAAEYTQYYADLRRYSAFGNTISDIGASNVEKFIDHLIKSGGHEQFDYVVVPATVGMRGESESISTLLTLLDNVGVAPARIRVVLNQVDKCRRNTPIEQHFERLFAFADQDGRVQSTRNANSLNWKYSRFSPPQPVAGPACVVTIPTMTRRSRKPIWRINIAPSTRR